MDTAKFEAMLRAHRKELLERLEGIEHELDQPVDPDVEERATEREADEVLEEVGEVGLNEIRAIDAALKRMEDGSYGSCVSCGEDISQARLEAVPYASQCRNCAR